MSEPNVIMLSFWRNDVGRDLTARAAHLLDKTYESLTWLWVVSDSTDGTMDALWAVRDSHPNGGSLLLTNRGDTGIADSDPNARMLRFSAAAQAGLACIVPEDDVVVIHESDLETPPDLVERLLAVGKDVVGGWPVLGSTGLFYDTWAYRGLDGVHFTNEPPYHADYQLVTPFEVQSVGSCWRFPAAAVHAGLHCTAFGAVELCAGLRQQGYRIWCDPRIPVVQPLSTFIPQPFPTEVPA